MSSGSCSTQPDAGKCCGNSCCADRGDGNVGAKHNRARGRGALIDGQHIGHRRCFSGSDVCVAARKGDWRGFVNITLHPPLCSDRRDGGRVFGDIVDTFDSKSRRLSDAVPRGVPDGRAVGICDVGVGGRGQYSAVVPAASASARRLATSGWSAGRRPGRWGFWSSRVGRTVRRRAALQSRSKQCFRYVANIQPGVAARSPGG